MFLQGLKKMIFDFFVPRQINNIGRWNRSNPDKYFEWANIDNCYMTINEFSKKIEK